MDRRADRLVTATAICVAVGLLVAAAVSAFLPATDRAGLWLPLHLALAGAASTAIAGVMPFFSAAIATSQPVDARLRWASVLAVSLGAAAIALGVTGDARSLAAVGGLAFGGGMALVGQATLVPLRRGLGPRGGVVAFGYAAALAMVFSGALLATLYLAGLEPVLETWARLKPAHAWLNLVGFVSLIIATTLLHFFPTVIGSRIQRTRAAYATPIGIAVGTALVALGFALASDMLARAGAAGVAIGAVALAAYTAQVWRTRSRWSGDHGWHLFAMGGLVSAIAWFELGVALAASAVLLEGAAPGAVSVRALAGPLVAGWIGLAVLASATHLLPSIGPGGPHDHARQRGLLGRGGRERLVVADLGVAALTAGLLLETDWLTSAGLVLAAVVSAATAALLLAALATGLRGTSRANP